MYIFLKYLYEKNIDAANTRHYRAVYRKMRILDVRAVAENVSPHIRSRINILETSYFRECYTN